jgi:hypothetical protein
MSPDTAWLMVGILFGCVNTVIAMIIGAKLMYRKQGGYGSMFEHDGYSDVEETAGETDEHN